MSDKLSLYEVCTDCDARCCRAQASPMVLPEERERILSLGKGDFIEKVEGRSIHTILANETGCPYLEDGKCSIQTEKPLDCRIYPLGLDLELRTGISDVCAAKHLLNDDFFREAAMLVEGLSEDLKKDLAEYSHELGYHFDPEPSGFGKELLLDLYGCNPDVLRSRDALVNYNSLLAKLLEMEPVGEVIIPEKYGKGTLYGHSSVQFIQTSSILVHIIEAMLEAHINIFSCKDFNAEEATTFTEKFFKARKIKSKTLLR